MIKRLAIASAVLTTLVPAYFWVATTWSYSSGERAGWVQKLSKKGWVCKTWEGELSMVSLPGSGPEKFAFTVWDDSVAQQITKVLGKRVTLHYEQKVGLPGSCFGDTRYYITGMSITDDYPNEKELKSNSAEPGASQIPSTPR